MASTRLAIRPVVAVEEDLQLPSTSRSRSDDEERRVRIHLGRDRRRRSLTGRCQHFVSTIRTDQRRRALGGRSGVVQYNGRTTRRAPTGSYWRLRQRCSAMPILSLIREDADERGPTPTGVGALITRRSQVQILPPPPSGRKSRSKALSEESERASVVRGRFFGLSVDRRHLARRPW